MRLVYVGPHDEVEVPDAGVIAKRDEAVEVADEQAYRLLEQRSNWAQAPTEKKDGKA